MKIARAFVHGLESTSQGTKGVYFKANFPEMIVNDYHGNANARLAQLNEELRDKENMIIVGSSYGGLVGAMYACENPQKVKRLVLLAPAINLDEFTPYLLQMKVPVETILYHGSNDDIVSPAPVKRIATSVFGNLKYHLVDDNHPLQQTFSKMNWQALLNA